MAIYNNITVLILAGGKSTRMGQDKGLMELDGKPMISYVIDVAKKISERILIVANLESYNQFNLPVIKDVVVEKGPIGGIYSGLKKSETEYNLVLSCDIPFIHQGVLEFLVESSTGYDITVASQEGKLHPLVGVYRKTCLPVIKKHLNEDKLKLTLLFDELKTRLVEMDDFLSTNFRNINSKSDL
ncbi:MAG: molybdenum cofactor guanylyltransferase [Crocinitomicaceae bacterium]|nr:molybdenum cofactor guanylyltransferase [Crocinitomicaceae bacterium]